MSYLTSWFVGSIASMGAQTYEIRIGAAAPTDYTIPSGDYYLFHATAANSLLDEIVSDLTAEGATNASWYMTESGHVAFTADQTIRFDFTQSPALQTYLGSSIVQTATATTITFDRHSYLFWSPGANAECLTPITETGLTFEGVVKSQSANGRRPVFSRFDGNDPLTKQEWSWDYVPQDRAWTASTLGGEFKRFRDTVLIEGYRFVVYHNLREDRESSTNISIDTSDALGPYSIESPPELHRWYTRHNPHQDQGATISFAGVLREAY